MDRFVADYGFEATIVTCYCKEGRVVGTKLPCVPLVVSADSGLRGLAQVAQQSLGDFTKNLTLSKEGGGELDLQAVPLKTRSVILNASGDVRCRHEQVVRLFLLCHSVNGADRANVKTGINPVSLTRAKPIERLQEDVFSKPSGLDCVDVVMMNAVVSGSRQVDLALFCKVERLRFFQEAVIWLHAASMVASFSDVGKDREGLDLICYLVGAVVLDFGKGGVVVRRERFFRDCDLFTCNCPVENR